MLDRMKTFARAVVSGFAFSLGSALFRKVAPKLGLEDKNNGKKDAERAAESDAEIVTDDGGDTSPALA
jgi:hypothetical protein